MSRDARTNRRIKAREVRVLGDDGSQLGILPIEEAIRQAQEKGLDLVEISPLAKPPVCKIMDYGKFKYEQKKRANEAKKKQAVVELKEVKLRPRTEAHDYGVKLRAIRRFLDEGNKARVTVMFRGREMTHREIGQEVLQRILTDVKDVGIIEQAPRMEGRQMFMLLAPNPKARQQQQSRPAASVSASASPSSAARPSGASSSAPMSAPVPAAVSAPPAAPAQATVSATASAPGTGKA